LVHWGVNRHTVDKLGGLSVIIPIFYTCYLLNELCYEPNISIKQLLLQMIYAL
jgi:hypothetical protein